jgi:hypothetical protein
MICSVLHVHRYSSQVKGQPLAWGSKAGQDLLSSVVLSEHAQMFAIGTQIHQARSYHIYTNTTSAAVCFVGAYSFAHTTNARLKGFTKPLAFRLVVYTIIGKNL